MSSIVVAFVALFVVVEPLGVAPLFLSLTRGQARAEVRRTAARASVTGALVLVAFALAGAPLLRGLGIDLAAFRVAGGAVLLLSALDMVRQTRACRCSPAEAGAAGRDDVAIVPLAVPLLAGPGAMAAVLGLVAREPVPAVVLAIALVFLVTYAVLRAAALLDRLLGPAVLAVVQRVLGLLLAAMSVQAIVSGVRGLLAATA